MKYYSTNHDPVYASDIEYLLQLIKVAYFDFNLQILTFFFQIVVSTGDSLFYSACKVYM